MARSRSRWPGSATTCSRSTPARRRATCSSACRSRTSPTRARSTRSSRTARCTTSTTSTPRSRRSRACSLPGGRLLLHEHAWDVVDEPTLRWYHEHGGHGDWRADHAGLHSSRGDARGARAVVRGAVAGVDAVPRRRAAAWSPAWSARRSTPARSARPGSCTSGSGAATSRSNEPVQARPERAPRGGVGPLRAEVVRDRRVADDDQLTPARPRQAGEPPRRPHADHPVARAGERDQRASRPGSAPGRPPGSRTAAAAACGPGRR